MLSFTFFDSAEWETRGISERFVSEEAYKTQQNLKDAYMQRDQKHMETISELRKQLEEKQEYIKTLEEHIASQRTAFKVSENNRLDTQLKYSMLRKDIEARNDENTMLNVKLEELQNENKVLKARLKDAIEIDYTDSTDYIAQLHKNVLSQRKELRNLNKVLEKERKRNKELEELYSSAQKSVAMLNLKAMGLNQGIRDSEDLSWKEKYDELEGKWKAKYSELNWNYIADSKSLNSVIHQLHDHLKEKDEKIDALESGIKELSEANDDLKKKIRRLEDNDTIKESATFNKELEELYSRAQRDVLMLNLKVMELIQGIRDSADLTWKEKYDKLKEKWKADSDALNGVIHTLRGRLNQKDDKIDALESGIKELSEANDDLKKKDKMFGP